MKILVATLLITLSFVTHANVMSDYTDHLTETVNLELLENAGEVTSMKCLNHFVGVLCYSGVAFEEASQSSCKETYYYLGFGEKVYQRLCSTCWFTKGEEIHKPHCH